MRAYGIVQRPLSVRCPSVVHQSVRLASIFPLNDLFTRTTTPISTTLGRKHDWEMVDSALFKQRDWPFLGPKMWQNKEYFDKSSSHELLAKSIDVWHGAFFEPGV